MNHLKIWNFAFVALFSLLALPAHSLERKNCLNEKNNKSKVIAQEMLTSQWIQFEDYRIDVGGPEEQVLGEIDMEMVRRSMLECMHGTVKCLRKNSQEFKEGKVILSFDLSNEKRLFPKIGNLKVDLNGFSGGALQSCLSAYWSDVRFPQRSKETQIATVRMPLTIRKTGASK